MKRPAKRIIPPPFDAEQFKHDFASLVVKLEDAKEYTNDDQAVEITVAQDDQAEHEEPTTHGSVSDTTVVEIASGIAGLVIGAVVTCLIKMGRR